MIAWKLFAKMKSELAGAKVKGESLEKLREIAAIVGVGMPSILRQYETWPTRTLYYRRHIVETRLLNRPKGKRRRLAWLVFLAGDWKYRRANGEQSHVKMICDVDNLSILARNLHRSVISCHPALSWKTFLFIGNGWFCTYM